MRPGSMCRTFGAPNIGSMLSRPHSRAYVLLALRASTLAVTPKSLLVHQISTIGIVSVIGDPVGTSTEGAAVCSPSQIP